MKKLTTTLCLTLFGLFFLLCVGVTKSTEGGEKNTIEIRATTADGKTVILRGDGTWKFYEGQDAGKLTFKISALMNAKDDEGYDACQISVSLKNNTSFIFPRLKVAINIHTNSAEFEQNILVFIVQKPLMPGDIVTNENRRTFPGNLIRDIKCKDIKYYNAFILGDKRSIKGKRFDSDEDAQMFILKLLTQASDHDIKYGTFRFSSP